MVLLYSNLLLGPGKVNYYFGGGYLVRKNDFTLSPPHLPFLPPIKQKFGVVFTSKKSLKPPFKILKYFFLRFGIFFTFHTKNIGFYPSPQYNANGVISPNPNEKFDWVEKNLVTPSLPIGFSYPPKIPFF